MYEFKKFLKLLSIFIFTTTIFFGCGNNVQENISTLKIGATIDFPPFEFQDKNQTEYQGFDMDLIRAVAKKLNMRVEIQNLPFDELIPAVQSKKIDAAISAIGINEARAHMILFSDSYYLSYITIIVDENNTSIENFSSLNGKIIATKSGTIAANKVSRLENATVLKFDTVEECLQALKDKKVDASFNDKTLHDYIILRNNVTNIKSIPDLSKTYDYGIAINKENLELQQKINSALKDLRKSGEYDQIVWKWFGDQSTNDKIDKEYYKQILE